MGNYVFDADALIEAVEADGELPGPTTTWAATSSPTS
jgi:hypothetical protein